MSKARQQPSQQPRRQAATNPALALVVRANSQPRQNRKPKQRPSSSQPRKKEIRSRQPTLPQAHVPECSLMYASALLDPEGTSEGACVPYGFPTPSMKQKVFTRGTFTLGTTGQGFILYQPTLANDSASIFTTSSTSVGTAATALNAFTNITQTNLSKLMFPIADLVTNQTVASRLVSGGIKIRYAGTEANRNGTMTALEEPNHKNLYPLTGAQMRTYINSFVERPDPLGSFFSVNFSGPVTALETQFQNVAAPVSGCIAIFVDGIAADKYEFECYQHVEYVGQNVPGVSASHSDPETYAKIIETTKAITISEPLSDKNAPGGFKRFLQTIGSSISSVVKQHGPDVIGMISNALLPGSGIFTKSLLRANQRLAVKG